MDRHKHRCEVSKRLRGVIQRWIANSGSQFRSGLLVVTEYIQSVKTGQP